MKNEKSHSIKEKFLYFHRNKKSHLSLIGKNKNVNSFFSSTGQISNPNSLSLNSFALKNQSIRLMSILFIIKKK